MVEKRFLTTQETMERLGRSRKSIYLYRMQGKLTPHFRGIGGLPHYDAAEVARVMEFKPVNESGDDNQGKEQP